MVRQDEWKVVERVLGQTLIIVPALPKANLQLGNKSENNHNNKHGTEQTEQTQYTMRLTADMPGKPLPGSCPVQLSVQGIKKHRYFVCFFHHCKAFQ